MEHLLNVGGGVNVSKMLIFFYFYVKGVYRHLGAKSQ